MSQAQSKHNKDIKMRVDENKEIIKNQYMEIKPAVVDMTCLPSESDQIKGGGETKIQRFMRFLQVEKQEGS